MMEDEPLRSDTANWIAASLSVAEEYLAQTKEVLEWLQAHPNLQDNLTQS